MMSRLFAGLFFSICIIMTSILSVYWNLYKSVPGGKAHEMAQFYSILDFGKANDIQRSGDQFIEEQYFDRQKYVAGDAGSEEYSISKIMAKISRHLYQRIEGSSEVGQEGVIKNDLGLGIRTALQPLLRESLDGDLKNNLSLLWLALAEKYIILNQKDSKAATNSDLLKSHKISEDIKMDELKLVEKMLADNSTVIASQNKVADAGWELLEGKIHLRETLIGALKYSFADYAWKEDFRTNVRNVDHPNEIPYIKSSVRHQNLNFQSLMPPILFLITPTIEKPQQIADLTRLSQTLMLIPYIHWVVVEDGEVRRRDIANLLQRTGLSHTHLNAKTPDFIKKKLKKIPYKPRGSAQRNAGIDWLRELYAIVQNKTKNHIFNVLNKLKKQNVENQQTLNVVITRRDDTLFETVVRETVDAIKRSVIPRDIQTMSNILLANMVSKCLARSLQLSQTNETELVSSILKEMQEWRKESANKSFGVIYFADDDNTYDLEIFKQMRNVKKVGVWPVGLVGGLWVEKPIVDPLNGKIKNFDVFFGPNRDFALDMAAFAINFELLMGAPNAHFNLDSNVGYVETTLLKHLVTVSELEPLADNCTKVYVWHTKTQTPELQYESHYKKFKNRSSKNGMIV